jgi:hypothetical protein
MTGQDRPPDGFSFREIAWNVLAFFSAAILLALVLLVSVVLASWAWHFLFDAP